VNRDSGGWDDSAAAWIASVDAGDVSRSAILDAPMLEICSEASGKSVLDMGCGEGRFCRMLRELGARPIGVDPTPDLVKAARERDPCGDYVQGAGEALPFRDGAFDWVVSYLTLIDIAPVRAAIHEMARVSRPFGTIVVANLNSFATTSMTGWVKNDKGEKLYYPIDHYMEERHEWLSWKGIKIVNWHRPLSAYMDAHLSAGLRLMRYLEPVPSAQAIAHDARLQEDLRVPLFNITVWRKEPA
jgi:SAM-dependent methyltransferase